MRDRPDGTLMVKQRSYSEAISKFKKKTPSDKLKKSFLIFKTQTEYTKSKHDIAVPKPGDRGDENVNEHHQS